jgi:hypothetical protein
MATLKGLRFHPSVALLVFPFVILNSCTENQEVASVSGGRPYLSDPSIMPTVIFTLPAPNSIGPFNGKHFESQEHLLLPVTPTSC